MDRKYEDLYVLIRQDPEAGRYFQSLPNYVREAVTERAQSVNSLESLRDYAENLLRDDE